MTDVFKSLPVLTWRNIELPCTGRTVTFSHDDVRHKFEFKDGQIVESTGLQNRVFKYTIPARDGIEKGPYRNMFYERLPAFVAAFRDRSRGRLVDPVYGNIDAKPLTFSDDLDVQRRDGVDLTVEFIEAPQIEDDATEKDDVAGLSSAAGLLDEEVEAVDWERPEDKPEPTQNPLDAISGLGRQVERQGEKLSASLEDTAFRADKVTRSIDALGDPEAMGLRRSSQRVRDSAIQLQKRARDPLGNTKSLVVAYSTTLANIAQDNAMTVEELMKLNPGLARAPVVAANTVVQVYARG